MNNRTLFIVLVALLGLYGLTRLFSGKREATFDPNLVQVDTSAVTRIAIQPSEQGAAFALQRQSGSWSGKKDGRTVDLSTPAINQALGAVSKIRAKRVVAKTEEQWKDYGLSDAEARRIQVFAGDQAVADIYLGKMDFDQQARSATAYLRTGESPDVYAVDGFQTMSLPADLNSLRNRTVLKMEAGMEVTKVDYQQQEQSVQLERTPSGWMKEEALLDSARVENYLNALRNLSAASFADNFSPAGQDPLKTLTLSGNNMTTPFRVKVYQDTMAGDPFVIHSSLRPETYFSSDSMGIYNSLFGKLEDLIE